MTRDKVAQELARSLPATVDQLSPNGCIPSEEVAARWMESGAEDRHFVDHLAASLVVGPSGRRQTA